MANMAELAWTIHRMKNGGIRIQVKSVGKPVQKLLRTKREYMNKFINHLKAAEPYGDIWLYIDSTGGSVDSAMGMIAALGMAGWKKHKMRILIEGNCGSAATLLLSLPWPVYITETSRIFLHMPFPARYVKNGDGYRRKTVSAIGFNSTAGMFVGEYRRACRRNGIKHTKKEIKLLMEEGKSFTPQEAVEFGFCKEIMNRWEFDKG